MNKKKSLNITGSFKNVVSRHRKRLLTLLFYSFISLTASLFLFLVFYWSLRLNSSIYSLINNTKNEPVYLWSYTLLTFGTIILFGVSVSLFVHRWRKFGTPKLKSQTGGGLGSLVGIAASACPVCGSVLLSAIGITGGLAAFPLQGLELKALSFGLMALPVWFWGKEIKNPPCDKRGICLVAKDTSFRTKDIAWLLATLALFVIFAFAGLAMLKSDSIVLSLLNESKLLERAALKVLPEKGFKSKIILGDSIVRLVTTGVIDPYKFEAVYKDQAELLNELKGILTQPSYRPIILTKENANFYANLLWPLGLSNFMFTNRQSPFTGNSLFNFASTSGWTLGRAKNGGWYFNQLRIIELTPEQEALVTKIAQNTYRPCCNNSTFYQDCNHGSALLGLLELGASQGLTEDELYREALAFNSFWFPQTYTQTALYFKEIEHVDWKKVDAKVILGRDFSSISGWHANVNKKIKQLGLLPEKRMGVSCGV